MELYSLHPVNGQPGLVEEVKVCLDENVDSTALALLGDADTLTLDGIIESKVEDAARLVHAEASHHLLDSGKELTGVISKTDNLGGYAGCMMPLPDDFLRLVTFRLVGWRVPVTDVIGEDDPLYLMQSSKYGGVRGNPERPVVALTHQGNTMSLELYSCAPGIVPEIKKASYIPMPKITDENKIPLCPKLKRAVVYRIASMTALALKDGDAAAALLATSNDLAGIVTANA